MILCKEWINENISFIAEFYDFLLRSYFKIGIGFIVLGIILLLIGKKSKTFDSIRKNTRPILMIFFGVILVCIHIITTPSFVLRSGISF